MRTTFYALLLCQAWHPLGSRISGIARTVGPQEEPHHASLVHDQCGKTQRMREVARILQEKIALGEDSDYDLAESGNPFEVMNIEKPEIERLAGFHRFCALGKLAKNGDFLASADGVIIAKRIEKLERQVLSDWNDIFTSEDAITNSVYPGAKRPGRFWRTYLVPILTTFRFEGYPYVVMPNVTHYYSQADPENWEVRAVYDAKPLPNLGEGLMKLVKGVMKGWGKEIRRMNEWEAWDEVRDQLSKDVGFLQHPKVNVVDFSLFVHVIQRRNPQSGLNARVPDEFSVSKGCITDPSRNTVVCFRVLDYLTPFTWQRGLESQYKASKFDDYAKKFLLAFDCIGDVERSDCENYKALASITAAIDVSKAMAKGVFIGVEAFSSAYTCTYEVPRLQYRRVVETYTHRGLVKGVGDVLDPEHIDRENPKTAWKEIIFDEKYGGGPLQRELNARWLQKVASLEKGTQYIRDFCHSDKGNYTDMRCLQEILQFEDGHNPAERTGYEDFKRCVTMINEFSTESYTDHADKEAEMHNVLYNQDMGAIVAVRGLPRIQMPVPLLPNINYTHYRHKQALGRGRLGKCFMRTRYLLCTPEEKDGVYFNYKQHFGTLEVMVLYGSEYSKDLPPFAAATQNQVNLLQGSIRM